VPRVVEPLLAGKSWNVHIPYPIHNVEKFPCRTEVRYVRRCGPIGPHILRLNPQPIIYGETYWMGPSSVKIVPADRPPFT
jgi:hypothetical protein